MDKNIKEIERVFINYMMALEKDDMDILDNVFDDDVELYSTNVGNASGIEESKKMLKWKGSELSFVRYRGFSSYIRYNGNTASQSVVVMALIDDTSETYRPMQFSNRYFITYKKKGDDWRMKVIRSNLDWMFGPIEDVDGWLFKKSHYSAPVPSKPEPMTFEYPEYIQGWWPKHDSNAWLGHFPSVIVGELDSPWIVIPEDEAEYTEEEQIKNTYLRYAVCLETGNFKDMGNEVTQDVIFYYRDPRDRANNIRELWRNMKDELFRAAVYEHVGIQPEITINGNEAVMKIYRIGPREIPYRTSLQENRDYIIASNRYTVNLKKENGKWMIYQFDHMPCFDRIPFEDGKYLY